MRGEPLNPQPFRNITADAQDRKSVVKPTDDSPLINDERKQLVQQIIGGATENIEKNAHNYWIIYQHMITIEYATMHLTWC